MPDATPQPPADPQSDLDALRAAGSTLYDAGHWTCDRPVEGGELALWTALRDALGRPPGTSPAPMPDATSQPYEEWKRHDVKWMVNAADLSREDLIRLLDGRDRAATQNLARAEKAETEMHRIRPIADAYRRVCQLLGIENNILGHVETLRAGKVLVERERDALAYERGTLARGVRAVLDGTAPRPPLGDMAGIVTKRHTDSRGEILWLDWHGVKFNLIFSKEGSWRSGDFHPHAQHDLVISGHACIDMADPATGEESPTAHLGAFGSMCIPAGVAHLFYFALPTVMLEWWDGPFSAEYYPPYRKIVEASLAPESHVEPHADLAGSTQSRATGSGDTP